MDLQSKYHILHRGHLSKRETGSCIKPTSCKEHCARGTEKRVEKISQESMKLHTTPEGTSKRGAGISCLGRVGLRKRSCLVAGGEVQVDGVGVRGVCT